MKRALAILLAASLSAALVTGCGKGNEEKPSESESEQETTADLFGGDNPMYIDESFNPETSVVVRNDPDRYSDRISRFMMEGLKKDDIVFYGSSGFTRWSESYGNPNLEDAILSDSGEKVCVNRGFGGSNVHDLCLQYANVLQPYEYKALVITTFMNASGYDKMEQMELLVWLITQVRKDNPDAHIYVTDFRPTAKTKTTAQINTFKAINEMLKTYCDNFDNVSVIELSKEPMFYEAPEYAGTYLHIDQNFFIDDQVHYTPEGYAQVAEVFREAIKDELK